MSKFTVLSLGAGVQSTTILLMSIKGQLPKPDIAIFADTGAESQATYAHLAWLTKLAGENSIPIARIQAGDLKNDILNANELKSSFIVIPAHCINKTGIKSILRRQCTREYKIAPIRHEIRRWLCVTPNERIPSEAVDLWIGISTDEANRMLSYRQNNKWLIPVFPLVNMMPMSRQACLEWLAYYYPNINVPRSACVCCPYQCNNEWQSIKNTSDWDVATSIDNALRNRNGGYITDSMYLHSSCRPLTEVDFRTPEDFGQLVLPDFKIQKLNQFANMEGIING
ncbi:hypothetical protein [Dehalococcoides mccartyi]|uniref:hypothetical protein n=1 Tax=Dehalococcoides mccartyi TaxID=61435 RepID=UPI0006BC431A|nr:hypothetical protein [Dehalococcoides mccartyi]BAS31185.1 hypothetical protein IBK_0110 [Dehalococcoides mccartyi IBARAKI]